MYSFPARPFPIIGQPPGDCVAERNWARVRLAEKRRQGVPAEKLYTISDGPICLVFFIPVWSWSSKSEFKGDWAITQSGQRRHSSAATPIPRLTVGPHNHLNNSYTTSYFQNGETFRKPKLVLARGGGP